MVSDLQAVPRAQQSAEVTPSPGYSSHLDEKKHPRCPLLAEHGHRGTPRKVDDVDLSVRAGTKYEQLQMFDPAMPCGVPVRRRLLQSAWSLVMSGDLSLARWEPLVVEAVRERFARNEQTVKLMVGNILRLFTFTRAHGIHACDGWTTRLVRDWCWAPRPDGNGPPQQVRDVNLTGFHTGCLV